MYLSAPRWWGYPVNLAPVARNWTQDQDAAQRRMSNNSGAISVLGGKVNHLAGFSPRVNFAQCLGEEQLPQIRSLMPLFASRSFVLSPNGQTAVARMLTLPRLYDDTTAAKSLLAIGSGGTIISAPAGVYSSAARWPEDLMCVEVDMARSSGLVAGTDVSYELAWVQGYYSIVDLLVQDKSIPTLDTGKHACVRSGDSIPGHAVLSDQVEELRYQFDRLRSGNLPVVFEWHATGTPDGWATSTALAAGGDYRGMWITSTSLVNCLDSSVAARSATSPGFVCPAMFAGCGPQEKTAGKSVGVKLSIVAAATGGAGAATIRFQGPNHVANNYVDISIPTGEAVNYYTSTSLLSLNTTSMDEDTTLARNKVDILAMVDAEGDSLYIYDIKGELYIA